MEPQYSHWISHEKKLWQATAVHSSPKTQSKTHPYESDSVFITKTKTLWALGLSSVARVAWYRLGVRTGLNPVRRLRFDAPSGPFFGGTGDGRRGTGDGGPTTDNRQPTLEAFGWFRVDLGEGKEKFPDWHENPFNGKRSRFAGRPWWEVPDFDPEVGDIKTIWEASRWDWVVRFAMEARDGDGQALRRLDEWLADWLRANPPYFGPNWKCGQEASIRVMHLAMAATVLGRVESPGAGVMELVRMHLRRIAPTISYAVGQNNNHGTSEAAAMFIGGTWLARHGGGGEARKWARSGRRWLENRVAKLVEPDGSFSQYSVNYHRVLVDTLSLAETWRRRMDEAPFSGRFLDRARAAVEWLAEFTDPESGDAPNLGANDGARLLPLRRSGYRDYRPSVQLGAALFCGEAEVGCLLSVVGCRWAEVRGQESEDRGQRAEGRSQGAGGDVARDSVPLAGSGDGAAGRSPAPRTVAESRDFADGGYAVLRRDGARVYFRYPRFRFRPGHADALHVDLWLGSRNVLRDGGSFSYADPEWGPYFSGTASHNTVQFDGRDQMPRLGRFLFGEWLKVRRSGPMEEDGEAVRFSAGYRDWLGARHDREVELAPGRLRVEDRVRGFRNSAVLRWRLEPGEWRLDGYALSSPDVRIEISAEGAEVRRMELVTGHESRFYMKMEDLPVLEVEIAEAGRVETVVVW